MLIFIVDRHELFLWKILQRKDITMTNAFPKILHEPNHKPNKIGVDKSMTKLTILFYFTIMKKKCLTTPITLYTLLLFKWNLWLCWTRCFTSLCLNESLTRLTTLFYSIVIKMKSLTRLITLTCFTSIPKYLCLSLLHNFTLLLFKSNLVILTLRWFTSLVFKENPWPPHYTVLVHYYSNGISGYIYYPNLLHHS